jgi:hypothetical protein
MQSGSCFVIPSSYLSLSLSLMVCSSWSDEFPYRPNVYIPVDSFIYLFNNSFIQ